MHTILLIEDDRDIRETYAELLAAEGYATAQAENGRVGLLRLGEMAHLPCLVLLDMMMPEMTGAQLLEVMGETHALAALPVVLISGSVVSESDRRGARRFVKKPVSLQTLMLLVKEFCGPA